MSSLYGRIMGRLRGHQLAVLGERGVGKTHLQTFLRENRIPTEYQATAGNPSLQPGRATLINVSSMNGAATRTKVALKAGRDVSGAAEAVDAWETALRPATVLLYLFRADDVFNGDATHLARVQEDVELIRRVRDHASAFRGLALVGTHYDCVPGYEGPQRGVRFYRWHNEVADNPVIAAACRDLDRFCKSGARVVVGSMKTMAETQELLFRVFAQELEL